MNVKLHQVLAEQAEVKAQLVDISEKLARIREEKSKAPGGSSQITTQPSNRTSSSLAKTQLRDSQVPVESQVPTLEVPDSRRNLAEVVKQQIPRGYAMEADGFMRKENRRQQESRSNKSNIQRRSQHPMVTGVRAQGQLRPSVSEVRIFATRFDPNETEGDIKEYVTELIGDACEVIKIPIRSNRHASFIVYAKKRHEQLLLDPNSWEDGVQVRHFFGRFKTSINYEIRT